MDAAPQRENFAAGLAGALLGALFWVGYVLLLHRAGGLYVHIYSGMILVPFTTSGYILFAGSMGKRGLIASLVCCAAAVCLTYHHFLFWISVSQKFGLPLWEAVSTAGQLEQQGRASRAPYHGLLFLALLFSLRAAVVMILTKGMSGMGQEPPRPAAKSKADEWSAQLSCFSAEAGGGQTLETPAGTLTLYLPEPRWAQSFWLGDHLLFALLLAAGTWLTAAGESSLLFGAGGAAIIVSLSFFSEDCVEDWYGSPLLMRKNGVLWAVRLKELNRIRGCRFTEHRLNLPGIRWQRLTPQERAGAVQAMLRAVAALETRPPDQWSRDPAWHKAVLPELQVERQTHSRWKFSYTAQNGSRAAKWVYKLYPGFSPTPGYEPPREPLPLHPSAGAGTAAVVLLFGPLLCGLCNWLIA